MATRELGRFGLRDRLVETLGEDAATELMDSLPPFSWSELATRDDLDALKEWTETRFDNLEASIEARFVAVTAEFVRVRGEIAAVEGRLSLQIAELAQHVAGLSEKMSAQSADLSEKMSAQSADLSEKMSAQSADLSEKMAAQSRMLVFTFAGFAATICGAMAGGILFA